MLFFRDVRNNKVKQNDADLTFVKPAPYAMGKWGVNMGMNMGINMRNISMGMRNIGMSKNRFSNPPFTTKP